MILGSWVLLYDKKGFTNYKFKILTCSKKLKIWINMCLWIKVKIIKLIWPLIIQLFCFTLYFDLQRSLGRHRTKLKECQIIPKINTYNFLSLLLKMYKSKNIKNKYWRYNPKQYIWRMRCQRVLILSEIVTFWFRSKATKIFI